jgi:hypothetical protein
MFINGSYYAMPGQVKAFFEAFRLIVSAAQSVGGDLVWIKLKRYPALLLIYSTGVAAVLSGNYHVLREIASRPSVVPRVGEKTVPASIKIETHGTMGRDVARQLLENMEKRLTPVSDHVSDYLRDAFGTMGIDEAQYIEAFDNFEYLWCLLHVDAEMQHVRADPWAPYGSFIWRWQRYGGDGGEHRFSDEASRAIVEGDENWHPIRAGLFGGNLRRLEAAKEYADRTLDEIGRSIG